MYFLHIFKICLVVKEKPKDVKRQKLDRLIKIGINLTLYSCSVFFGCYKAQLNNK